MRSPDPVDDWCAIPGVLLAVYGVGVMLFGASGSGKSTLALELIDRGHRLVSDDAPLLRRIAPGWLEGRADDLLHGLLHVRGLGVLDLRRCTGVCAFLERHRVDLAIDLDSDPDDAELTLCGVPLPRLRLPADQPRALWVESAVRRHLLDRAGHDADVELARRQAARIAEQTPCA
jgi:HPr kinase/phosphorylase